VLVELSKSSERLQRYVIIICIPFVFYVMLNFSKEDLAIVQCSLQFLQVVLDKVNEYDEDLIVLIIQLILCAISNKVFQPDITGKISLKLTQQFRRLSNRIFSAPMSNQTKRQLKKEIKVNFT